MNLHKLNTKLISWALDVRQCWRGAESLAKRRTPQPEERGACRGPNVGDGARNTLYIYIYINNCTQLPASDSTTAQRSGFAHSGNRKKEWEPRCNRARRWTPNQLLERTQDLPGDVTCDFGGANFPRVAPNMTVRDYNPVSCEEERCVSNRKSLAFSSLPIFASLAA